MDPTTLYVSLGLGGLLYLALCGAFGSYAATEKGRSGMEGFWFGVALGPIGVAAVACLPDAGEFARAPDPAAMHRPILTADPDDIDDPDELARFLKRGGK